MLLWSEESEKLSLVLVGGFALGLNVRTTNLHRSSSFDQDLLLTRESIFGENPACFLHCETFAMAIDGN